MDVAPAAQAPTELQTASALDGSLGEIGDLHAALVDGTPALAINDGRDHEGSVDIWGFGGAKEDEVVDCAGGVAADDILDVGEAVEIVEDGVARLTGDEVLVGQLGSCQEACAGDLDPVGCFVSMVVGHGRSGI